MIHVSTIYTVKAGNAVVDSFSTDTYLTENAAITAARANRDRYNVSELGQSAPSKIVRSIRRRIVKPL